MNSSNARLLRQLKAGAEPTRLRILAVLALGEFSVTDLTEVLGQSQPRVSRHLKLLGDAGLLERFREQHWVYYRTAGEGAGAAVASFLLEQIDRTDPVVRRDLDRARELLRARGAEEADRPLPAVSDELARVLADELGAAGTQSLLYVGDDPAGAVLALGPKARQLFGVCPSLAEVRRARALAHGRGLAHCVMQQGNLRAMPPLSLRFGAVLLDRVLAREPAPARALQEAVRHAEDGIDLLLLEDYDSLTERGEENPLAAIRGWLAEAGLACKRLRPMDVGGRHVLLAVASSSGGAAGKAAA